MQQQEPVEAAAKTLLGHKKRNKKMLLEQGTINMKLGKTELLTVFFCCCWKCHVFFIQEIKCFNYCRPNFPDFFSAILMARKKF